VNGEGESVEPRRPGLTDSFAAPSWLRDLGRTAWLLVGVVLLLVGAVWILSLTHTIVLPVIAAGVVAAVASPLVAWLARHRVPRGLGAALILLAIVAAGAAMFVVIVAGITSQSGDISNQLSDAKHTLAGWLEDLGVDPGNAARVQDDASTATSSSFHALLEGVAKGITGLTSLVFFLSLTALSLFFLLKDGPSIRSWAERHLGVPIHVARTISGRTLQSLRGYFFGVTIIAAFNATVVGLGALLIGLIQAFNEGLSWHSPGSDWTQSMVFGILIIILVLRPEGLLGERTPEGG